MPLEGGAGIAANAKFLKYSKWLKISVSLEWVGEAVKWIGRYVRERDTYVEGSPRMSHQQREYFVSPPLPKKEGQAPQRPDEA